MLKNGQHIDEQKNMALQFYTSGGYDGKTKFKYERVPFGEMKAKMKAFDREKAWAEAPEYDLGLLKRQLGK